jgi:hypothetical protein
MFDGSGFGGASFEEEATAFDGVVIRRTGVCRDGPADKLEEDMRFGKRTLKKVVS